MSQLNCRGDIKFGWVFLFLLIVVLGAVLVGAADPTFKADTHTKTYWFLEDVAYTFNFSDNFTNPEEIEHYTIYPNLFGNETYHPDWDSHSNFSWFPWNDTLFTNSSLGVLKINSTTDNQTGNFTLSLYAYGTNGGGVSHNYHFIINATNDAPNFTVLDLGYNLSQGQGFNETITASDEDEMYPIWFNITWNTNCTHAAWSDRTNCSLFNAVNFSDISAVMNYTPVNNDAGVYWANVTIVDFGENEVCPHSFCNPADYEVNKSLMSVVKFTVLSTLSINVTNCAGTVANEGTTFSCLVNISTQGEKDAMDISTVASLTNYDDSGIVNKSWFYGNGTNVVASSNSKTINASFTAYKPEIGNWTISFTVDDLNDSVVAVTELIYINVTRVNNNVSQMSFVENLTTSIDLPITIYFNASDEDFLIPDKGVFNETVTWGRTITKGIAATDADSLFGAITLGSTSANLTQGIITFTPESADVGWYTINISATDVGGVMNSTIFNITISDNAPPIWNQTSYTINLTVAATLVGTTRLRLDLNDTFVNDTAGNILTFSNTTNFTNFNLTTWGDLNFTPWKQDVGTWRVNITATDVLGLANTTEWVFNISNTNSEPNITVVYSNTFGVDIAEEDSKSISEDSLFVLNWFVEDYDFLITSEKKTVYNESLNTTIIFKNFTGDAVTDLFDYSSQGISGSVETFEVRFTPNVTDVGNYSINISVIDNSSVMASHFFYLNITAVDDAPILLGIYNQTITNVTPNNIFYMDVNASDEEEDGAESAGLLDFTISSLTAGGDFLVVNMTTGVINFTVNSTSLGIWVFNVSVNDTAGGMDSELFNVSIYGTPVVESPSADFVFNLTENSLALLGFIVNHTIEDNLTYEFYIDNIAYSNSIDYSYGPLVLRETINSYGNLTNYSWSFTPNFTDETYGLLKNLTLVVYPNNSQVSDVKNVNTTVRFKLNMSHTNSPPEVYTSFGNHSGTYGSSFPINLNLNLSFRDVDYDDPYYNQTVNFTVTSDEGTSSAIRAESSDSSNGLPWNGSVNLWYLQLYALEEAEELITILANDSQYKDTSDPFQVSFTAPSIITTPVSSGGGGGSTKIKHYSLKIVNPQDVIITPEKNLIQIPFSIENNGQIDLKGINLSSFVRFNDQFSKDIRISLDDGYIKELKFGQSEDFVMTIRANTQKSGRYKATIYANVTNPKFSDWGDFFIDLRKTNETGAEQLLIFTEKFISENPECIELTELLKEARTHFGDGDFSESYRLSQQAIEACEESVSVNEQVTFGTDAVRDSFYYMSFATLAIFFVGFIFYVYKRVRFNKAKVDEYI